jgi:hypothetical protein
MICMAGRFEPYPWSYPGFFSMLGAGGRTGGPNGGKLPRLRSTTPVPILQPYNPATQDRNEYLRAIQEQLRTYCDAVEAEFTLAGFEPTHRKRQRSGPQWMHLEWVVRNRVELWPQTRIAREYRVSETVVSKGIRETAGLLGFPKGRSPFRA